MILINLKDYYKDISNDHLIWVSPDILAALEEFSRNKSNEARNKRRRPKNITLNEALPINSKNPAFSCPIKDMIEENTNSVALQEAISKLPEKQAKRIYAYYFLGFSKSEIAKMEGVNKCQISRSIKKALFVLRELLK